jgi:hypothetical protein
MDLGQQRRVLISEIAIAFPVAIAKRFTSLAWHGAKVCPKPSCRGARAQIIGDNNGLWGGAPGAADPSAHRRFR